MASSRDRPLSAGEMRERVQFQRPSRVRDHGFGSVSWLSAFTVWAASAISAGVNDLTQDRRASKLAVDFDMRYRADVTSDMRAVWRGKTFEVTDILSNPPLGRMVVRCLEESAP